MKWDLVACQCRLTIYSSVYDNSTLNFKLLSAVTAPPSSCNGQRDWLLHNLKRAGGGRGRGQSSQTHRENGEKTEKGQQKVLLRTHGNIQVHNVATEKWDAIIRDAAVTRYPKRGDLPSNQYCFWAMGSEIIEQTAMWCHRLFHSASCNKHSVPKTCQMLICH